MKINADLLIQELSLALNDYFELKEIKRISNDLLLVFENGPSVQLSLIEK